MHTEIILEVCLGSLSYILPCFLVLCNMYLRCLESVKYVMLLCEVITSIVPSVCHVYTRIDVLLCSSCCVNIEILQVAIQGILGIIL